MLSVMVDSAKDALAFPHNWSVEILKTPPLIAPARQFIYPKQIAGEEDALATRRAAVDGSPRERRDVSRNVRSWVYRPGDAHGVFACPNAVQMCAVAGGYAYVIDTSQPEHSTHITLKPVVEVRPLVAQGLLLFVGFHSMMAWGPNGLAWESARLSWEGVRITSIDGDVLHGMGWNLLTDQEVAFSVDLLTGQHQGGGFAQPPGSQKN